MKISKFKKLTSELSKLSEKIWASQPPKDYVLFWLNKRLDREYRFQRFYTKQEMLDFINFVVGYSDPKFYEFIMAKEIKKGGNSSQG